MGNEPSHCNTTTHISNACNYPIWAMVDADRAICIKAASSLSMASKDTSMSGSSENEWQIVHVAKSVGFTKILPGNYLPFQPGGVGDTVYITIYYQRGTTMVSVCECWPRRRDYSVTVGADYQVHPVQYGKLW